METVTFDSAPDPALGTDETDVYPAKYTVPAPEKYHTSEILSATIKQLYYVNKKEQILIL